MSSHSEGHLPWGVKEFVMRTYLELENVHVSALVYIIELEQLNKVVPLLLGQLAKHFLFRLHITGKRDLEDLVIFFRFST